ncbi:Os04g0293600 [Oryza sativa Japonica Group]|uniref:Os04g0293600 protein n=2 Tax=Oryza sativa subsp. japonica TaxID=39947 RepID=Q0JEC8_ORYSJ|nr:hypothetical protein EE612_022900 [Oryza sativa]BAF14309.1 Os04g0293600 [Oryza sativa Japonica Group]BAG88515.1 unnamed protein product [Oryza sativa Japonica Group]BAS88431.1 Os04g0293600 [Oryza sativa Japonica Group]|eukprot:NP_001052395.1 Os04g0293600 [Oryza sativa Japonica Group]
MLSAPGRRPMAHPLFFFIFLFLFFFLSLFFVRGGRPGDKHAARQGIISVVARRSAADARNGASCVRTARPRPRLRRGGQRGCGRGTEMNLLSFM